MRTCNELKAIDMIELCSNFVAKQPSSPARRHSPRSNIFWIAPYQIAESAFVRNLLGTSNDTDLVEGANLRTQATVDAEDLAVDDCTEHKEIKYLAAGFPNGCIAVLLLAFFVESVDLSDLAGLVIAAYKGHAIRVSGAGS